MKNTASADKKLKAVLLKLRTVVAAIGDFEDKADEIDCDVLENVSRELLEDAHEDLTNAEGFENDALSSLYSEVDDEMERREDLKVVIRCKGMLYIKPCGYKAKKNETIVGMLNEDDQD